MTARRRPYLLIADDFGLAPGISAGIAELARAGRLSGASAIVTLPDWLHSGDQAAELRGLASLGLHLNLTLGAPLGPMPFHSPDGKLSSIKVWIARALAGRIAAAEVEAEIDRQFAAFEAAVGAAPDHVDGHHHVHALPGIRRALESCLRRRYPPGRLPLVRDPGDRTTRILARRAATPKALLVSALSAGAGSRFHACGAPVNGGFAGFSSFRIGHPYASEIARFEASPGPLHLVMCHPGHANAAALDSVSCRRAEELAALASDPTLPERICHPARHRDAEGHIDWAAARAN